MHQRSTSKLVAVATLLLVGTLAACGAPTDEPDAAASGDTTSGTSPTSVPEEAEPLLAEYGLDGMDTVEIIDHLDRLAVADRPQELMASVRPDRLVLTDGGEEYELDIRPDRFYLSVAPYVDQTHDCFHHSLTTCTGELASVDIEVEVVDETTGEVLVDETRTTFDNGFTGFWVPRDIDGILRVTYDGKTGEAAFTTDRDAPTCLTTLELA